ncbi:hypothetical protein CDAR_6981 [Caerostris darwini]|uniref:Uncharacterized protein n=1 Tax=Caerostris darwini TaxID=1538125 RepID=A0AAV4PG11_9ARAC|nr:hypothetical protein CDAR_6981 [Caerostris darwini]
MLPSVNRLGCKILFSFTKEKLSLFLVLGKLDEKASQLHAIASLRVLLDAAKANGGYPSGTHPAPTSAGGCCASCSQCPQCVACPTCQRPLVRNPPDAAPLNSYIVTASDYPPPHSPLPAIGGATGPSGTKRTGQDLLTNVQTLQSATLLNTLANGSASEHADRERHEETSFCTTTASPTVISTIMSTDGPSVAVLQPTPTTTASVSPLCTSVS